METSQCVCPRCDTVLRPTLAKCYFWGPEAQPSFAVETLWRCLLCAEVYFEDEVKTPAAA